MKKKTLILGLVIALLTAGTVVQAAPGFGPEPGYGPGNCRKGGGPGNGAPDVASRLDRMTTRLHLTPEQRTQVQAILTEREAKIAPLRQQMIEARNQMRQLTFGGNYDEAQVRTLAARRAKLQEEMAVGRAETRHRIHALLTPEQQSLAAQRGGMHQGRRGGRCW